MSWLEKRRDNRIDINPGKELSILLEDGLVVQVRNVSLRGSNVIFSDVSERAKAPVEKIFSASLTIGDVSIPIKMKVVRWVGGNEAGLQFMPPFPKELATLERFLEPRFLGRSLREIDPKILQKEIPKGMRWFQGTNETNLFSWSDQQQLVFLGRVVEWKENGSVRTGHVREDNAGADGRVSWVQSDILDFDTTPDNGVLNQALALIESSQIEDAVKRKFLEKLRSRP